MEKRESKHVLVELNSDDISAIIKSEQEELLSHKDIAVKHNISVALAGRVIRAAKKDKEFVVKRQQKEHKKRELRKAVRRLIAEWNEDEDSMLSPARLRKKLKEETELDCSVTQLRWIMRIELGLRFKKIKQLAPQMNKLKNVLCRQQYAMRMLKLLASGKRVINVDESWLNSMVFKRHSWTKKGKKNARPVKELSSRVSFLSAIDNRGAAYISLGTANTDSAVMVAFLFELAKQLDREDPFWRDNSVVLLDNASYHRSIETRVAIKKLGMPTIYSGPYSYISAPIELYFGLLKRGDLNPERKQLGKR